MFDPGSTTTIARACAAIRNADRLMAEAVLELSESDHHSGGLPAEMALRLDGRRPAWEAREMLTVARALARMPIMRGLLATEAVGYAQIRAIVREMRTVDDAARERIDDYLGRRAPALTTTEPERIIDEVSELASRARADLALAREDRAFERRALWIQQRLQGGAVVHGELDVDGAATLAEAIDAAAARPEATDEPDARAAQRADALVALADAYLAGGEPMSRPRPRLLATVTLAELTDRAAGEGVRVLTRIAGGPQRLTPVSTAVLACDTYLTTVLFDGARPIAVGDATKTIPDKVRTAVTARDAGCRFPGCSAPAGWAEIHHINGRGPDAGHDPAELVSLCRRCHRRVHRHRWRIEHRDDGSIAFSRRAASYFSWPRARPIRA